MGTARTGPAADGRATPDRGLSFRGGARARSREVRRACDRSYSRQRYESFRKNPRRVSIKRAADRVEYAETAAKYEYLNLSAGEGGEGLSADELRLICKTFGVQQAFF